MIEIIKTKICKEILRIINKPEYKKWLIDKKGQVLARDLDLPVMTYYLFRLDGVVAGYGAIRHERSDVNIVDIAILNKFRGTVGREIALMAIKKYAGESTCKVLVTRIDKLNKKSLYFTKWLGFEEYINDDKYIYLRLELWAEQADKIHQTQHQNI